MSAFDHHALTILLEQQRYEEVAPQLDEEELNVCQPRCIRSMLVSALLVSSQDAIFACHQISSDFLPVQSATQEVLSGSWPVVIHLLGHLYNGRL